jgi:hypothetical protein
MNFEETGVVRAHSGAMARLATTIIALQQSRPVAIMPTNKCWACLNDLVHLAANRSSEPDDDCKAETAPDKISSVEYEGILNLPTYDGGYSECLNDLIANSCFDDSDDPDESYNTKQTQDELYTGDDPFLDGLWGVDSATLPTFLNKLVENEQMMLGRVIIN